MQPHSLDGLDILVLDDETLLRKQLSAQLAQLGAEVTQAATLQSARQLAAGMSFDFALIDVNLADGRGTDLLRDKAFSPGTAVIVMTGMGGVEGAVEAMRLGAADYLVKPFEAGELPLVIARARRGRQAARIDEHRREEETRTGESFFFGQSLASVESQLQKILAADRRMQGALPPVLIEGETGTGKTTVARWLHRNGPRAARDLVEVNCSALPETLAESELFGHERGAFTDARTARMGLFEAADGGTLFLDELPSLSAALQAKVLTAIEDQKIRRLGGNKPISVDVRIIAATNRNLKEAVAAGAFREDLYHRLDLYRVSIPPLRVRGADIERLAVMLVEQICQRHRLPLRKFTTAGRERLLAYAWPGNVRELAHELERGVVFEESSELGFDHLEPAGPQGAVQDLTDWFNPEFKFPAQGFDLEAGINRIMQHALKQTDQNVSAAARLLGVTRDYIRYRLSGGKAPKAGGE